MRIVSQSERIRQENGTRLLSCLTMQAHGVTHSLEPPKNSMAAVRFRAVSVNLNHLNRSIPAIPVLEFLFAVPTVRYLLLKCDFIVEYILV